MKEKNIGVQRSILDIAVNLSCGCHSHNFVLCDAAKSSLKSITLFGVPQRLFTLLSTSIHRWKILTDGKRAFGSPDGNWLPPPTTECNTRGATGALPADKVGWAPDPGITWCETQWHKATTQCWLSWASRICNNIFLTKIGCVKEQYWHQKMRLLRK